jgi:hypothetical protein
VASNPLVSFNPRGEVTLCVEHNGITIYLRYPPAVARHIAYALNYNATGAEAMINAMAAAKERERLDTMELKKKIVAVADALPDHDVSLWEGEGGYCGQG